MELKIIKIYWCTCHNQEYPHKNIRNPKLHQQGKLKCYSFKILKWCCEEMESAYNNDFISFGKYDCGGLNDDKNVNILECCPYPEGTYWNEMPINFCPFCAERIKIIDDD